MGVPVWLLVHERTRSELESLFPGDGEHFRFVSDTYSNIFLYKVGKILPPRVANFTLGFAMRLLTQLKQRHVIRDLIREAEITVIHQPMPVSPKEPSLMFGFGIPVIIGPMNGGIDYPPAFRAMQGGLQRTSLWLGRKMASLLNILIPGKRRAEWLLVANERTLSALPDCIDRKNVVVLVENGVDLSLWKELLPRQVKTTRDSTEFVYLGRLVDWKAVNLLIESFASAVCQSPMTLTIIGDGVERHSLELLAKELGVHSLTKEENKVSFLGWLPQRECALRLSRADALVLPSLMECGGAVVLEAMAMSIPVIATNWGGPSDYLDDSCGILIDPTDRETFVNALASALQALARDPERRIAMGNAGRAKVVNHFDWEKKVDQMMNYYDKKTLD